MGGLGLLSRVPFTGLVGWTAAVVLRRWWGGGSRLKNPKEREVREGLCGEEGERQQGSLGNSPRLFKKKNKWVPQKK